MNNKNLSLGDMSTIKNDNMPTDTGQLLFTGDKIGSYKAIKLLGAGGMGQVYLVENIQIHKQYALKVLPPHLSKNKSFINRFRVEARVMADLKHPNIISVHNIGHDKNHDLYYLVMEYVEAKRDKPAITAIRCMEHMLLKQYIKIRVRKISGHCI